MKRQIKRSFDEKIIDLGRLKFYFRLALVPRFVNRDESGGAPSESDLSHNFHKWVYTVVRNLPRSLPFGIDSICRQTVDHVWRWKHVRRSFPPSVSWLEKGPVSRQAPRLQAMRGARIIQYKFGVRHGCNKHYTGDVAVLVWLSWYPTTIQCS